MDPSLPDFSGRRVCLVTSGPLGSSPRTVKEAEALASAGAVVTVVSLEVTGLAHVEARTASVLEGARWTSLRVGRGPGPVYALRTLTHKLARGLFARGLRGERLDLNALHRHSLALARVAGSVTADLFLAHNLGALPAAGLAARGQGARLGFDAEDFHSGEALEGPEGAYQRFLAEAVEARWLPRCRHLTAASPGIAQAYAARYALPLPPTVMNVFPLAEAPDAWTPAGSRPSGPSLYWFSQTLGPGRGLEDVVRAIGRLNVPVRLCLRGTVSEAYARALGALAEAEGVAGRLDLLPPAPPSEMARLAARHDLGLATEPLATPNSRLVWSNKIFTYLLAGLPSLASATPGQAALAEACEGAVFLHPPGDIEALASNIAALLGDAARLAAARKRAWELGQERFNWDRERRNFLAVVKRSLES